MTESQYNQCVDLFADGVFRFICKNLRDEDSSRDVVQNAFEILWNKHRAIEFDKAKSYLFQVAYNNMIDYIRKYKRMVHVEEFDADERYHENEYTGTAEMLALALKHLPEVQRSVVMLRDYEGYAYEEIAAITGLSLSQVKVYIFRARNTLRQQITKLETVK